MPDAFYVPDGDGFVSTELTRGPWDPGSQHAGPPAALIGRAIERLPNEGGPRMVGRITYEILRPVSIAPVSVSTRVVRPGRSVELVAASLTDESGNGISATLDFERFLFINVDLSVHLHRLPETEWVCLDSITIPETNGVGLTDTALYDERGPIGRAAQTLLV